MFDSTLLTFKKFRMKCVAKLLQWQRTWRNRFDERSVCSKGNDIYVLEVNPRASRTVPFVSKCIGESLAKVAARCMAGQS